MQIVEDKSAALEMTTVPKNVLEPGILDVSQGKHAKYYQ
jgi:hypothetical protein